MVMNSPIDTTMAQQEFEVGPDQVVVVYVPPDTGEELDPYGIHAKITEDAAQRDRDGLRIVSMYAMPLRHGGVYLGRNGSGFETRVSIVVLYERRPGANA